jgi:hypothetical protein
VCCALPSDDQSRNESRQMKNFLRHNKELMNEIKKNATKIDGIVLFEETFEYPRIIAMSYFAMYWSSKGYNLHSYQVEVKRNFVREFYSNLLGRLPVLHESRIKHRIYKSLSFSGRIKPGIAKLNDEDREIVTDLKNASKQEVLNLTFMGIHVGENFYDWYLRVYQRVTIDTNSIEFTESLAKFLQLTKWWVQFFEENNVVAVNISHSTYAQGLLARIAVAKNITCICVSFDKLYSLNKERVHSDCEFQEYEKSANSFLKYPIDFERSKIELDRLVTGNEFVTKEHRIKSGFQDMNVDFEFPYSECQYKSMIASHCFTDAPHQQGDFLFPDFYTWFEFMAEATLDSEHQWYVKPHPHFTASEDEAFRLIVEKYPHLVSIPKGVSNVELFRFGIKCVFTVHGTIAFDAATQGIMSVGATNNASFKNYGFSVLPRSVDGLREIILNLSRYVDDHRVSESEVLHYFDVHHLRPMYTWIFREKLLEISKTMSGYSNIFNNSKLLDLWLSTVWNQNYHFENLGSIEEFLKSGEYFVDGHFFKD